MIGEASAVSRNDRDPEQATKLGVALTSAFDLCLRATADDRPTTRAEITAHEAKFVVAECRFRI